ncbi:hypothetical protein D3C84_657220 [compost metagenome]
MGDDQQRHALAGQALDDFQHFLDHFRVEGGGDFIEQHDFGVHAQRTDDGDALLLAAGELARKGVALVREAHARQQGFGLIPGFATLAFLHLDRAEQQVVEHAHVREQVIALEYHADLLAHFAPVGAFVQKLTAGKCQAAAVRDFQPVEATQQGTFTAAAGAEDDDHFAGFHVQVDAIEHLLLAEKLVETLELDQCAHACVQRRSSTREAAESG